MFKESTDESYGEMPISVSIINCIKTRKWYVGFQLVCLKIVGLATFYIRSLNLVFVVSLQVSHFFQSSEVLEISCIATDGLVKR